MRIYPAVHYTMGGLWVDYELMTTIPGLYCAGEANFSDHGANRLGASALMQGLADGYFVLPNTISNYLAPQLGTQPVPTDHPAFQAAEADGPATASTATSPSAAPARPTRSTRSSARSCGTTAAWSAPRQGLEKALSEIPALHEEFRKDLRVTGSGERTQPDAREGRPGRRLLRAGPADVPRRPHPRGVLRRPLPGRAPDRGGRGRARRRALRPRRRLGVDRRRRPTPTRHVEPLEFDNVHLAVRSYK